MSEPLRPSSQPHPPATLLGDGGDYYIPGEASREPGVVLAAWFLLATDEEAPEVRDSLRSEVFSLLPASIDFELWRDRDGVFDLFADVWSPPERDAEKADTPEGRLREAMLPGVLALRDWARRYGLTSPHLMTVTIEILKSWFVAEILEVAGARLPHQDGWGRRLDFLADGWSASFDGEGEKWRQAFRELPMNGCLPAFRATIEDRWEPRLETRQEFVKRVQDRLAQNLEQYFEVSHRHLENHGFKKVPRKAARHHLTWLVQHRICGMTCEEIADRHAERNPQLESPPTGDAVSKAIRRTAAALQLV